MTLEGFSAQIENRVPLLPTESAHKWERITLFGCGVCQEHDGFECLHCRRCVDYVLDTSLYATIELAMLEQGRN